ncbi:MAG: hypothetical protein GY787_01835 [Alteromonadales bacterium]|jgi:hypothetical protein|nr:hypothetical protein [Alteromonadales bacterium]
MNKEIQQRAHNKAFSKLLTIERDISELKLDIRSGGDGRISVDMLRTCLSSTEKELQTWQYIATLIEKNNE